MRNRLMIGTAALFLASATLAWAQDKPQEKKATTESTAPSNGVVEVGGRFTSTTGDGARYERYRDLRNGGNVNLLFNKETDKWAFSVKATNVGYRDGHYEMAFNSRKLSATFMVDSTPLNYGYGLKTPYACSAGNCTLDSTLRAQVQASRGTGATPINSATIVGVPQTAAQIATGTIYNSIAKSFDMQSRRDTIAGEVKYSATDNLDLLFGFKTYKRSGNMPWGVGFAFNNLVEVPLTIDNRETDISAGIEWASHQGMFHVSYEHSKFDQGIPSVMFDNPLHATNWSSSAGTGWDASGYTNAHGAAASRMAMSPSNSVDTVNWLWHDQAAGVTPRRTRASPWERIARTRRSFPGRRTRWWRTRRRTRPSRTWRRCRVTPRKCTSTTRRRAGTSTRVRASTSR